MSRRGPKGLVWRGRRAYFDRRHERFRGGRLAISLRTSDPDIAHERHTVLRQLMDRGDWGVLEAIREGHLHITDAQAALREGDQKKLRRLGAEAPRLGEAAARMMRTKEATKAKNTVDQYRASLGLLVAGFGADYPMNELTTKEAQDYLHEEKETTGGEPWAPATQEVHRVICGALWAMVMREEAEELDMRGVQPSVTRNPWKHVETPRVRPTRAVFLMPEEWAVLDRRMAGRPVRALVASAFLAGLRKSEILHLRPGVDVLLEGAEPMLRVQSRGGRYPWKPKNERGERDVPITASLVEILSDHIRRGYAGERYLIRAPGTDRPMGRRTAMRWCKAAYTSAGIKYGREGDGLTLHSGRHTYASWLVQAGRSLNIVAELIGDTTETVERYYAHLVPDTLRDAVQSIEQRASQNNGNPITGAGQ